MEAPVYSTVHRLLTNPIYGGAYAFRRTGSRVTVENGRKRVRRGLSREREQWDVLIVDHHEGYVSWAEYERNQRVIADNAARYGLLTRGAVRRGEGLLAGLLRCGHCGRRLHVAYSGIKGKCVRYSCRGAHLNHGTSRCIAFGGIVVVGNPESVHCRPECPVLLVRSRPAIPGWSSGVACCRSVRVSVRVSTCRTGHSTPNVLRSVSVVVA